MLKKIVATLFGLTFLSFVIVQYNDPDPALWMIIYAIAALLCLASAFYKVNHTLLWIAATVFLAGGIYMWPEKYEGLGIGEGDIKNIEEAREALGLMFCTVAFLSLIVLDKLTSRVDKTVRSS
ncbi:transmembrane 220 family protein [Pontibacter locisalis]|uniref:Transmembrane 220 family protein n=1 Tax=Pontibacter locisalis TaxID=1719035 RepID=A0ABW5IPT9_9BACT